MPKAKFLLKEPNSKEETLVYLIYNYKYNRFKYSTGEKITPKFWNKRTHRAKETKKYRQYPEFNSRLDLIENGINNAYRKLLNDGEQPNNSKLKQLLQIELSDNIMKPKKETFLDFINLYVEESKTNKSLGTLKVYKTTLKYLTNYSNRGKSVDFDDINLEFYNDYIHFLKSHYQLADNTVGKHIKTIKAFMNEATERGLNSNLSFRSKKFKTIREESDNVYLSLNELKQIEDLDLKATPRLEAVRDLFLIGCFTGLRFSDFSKITPENIVSQNKIIEIRTQKTNDKVSIPLHETARRILKKYNNQLPKSISNQKMNEYLKEIVSLAGIKENIQRTITKAGRKQVFVLPKYKLVSTHTARRSFATNLYLQNVPTLAIMKITGHKTESSFLKYIKVTQEENANQLLTHPFFN